MSQCPRRLFATQGILVVARFNQSRKRFYGHTSERGMRQQVPCSVYVFRSVPDVQGVRGAESATERILPWLPLVRHRIPNDGAPRTA